MNPSSATELDVPPIMRIGAARMTAGLDRMTRLDLEAHTEIFGPLPRMSADDLITMAQQVDLRGQGGAAFPFARKLKAVVDASKKTGQPTIVVVNATEGEPGSFKDKMLMIRSPYLILSGAVLVAEAIEAEEIIIGVTSNELANRSIEAAIAAEPGLRRDGPGHRAAGAVHFRGVWRAGPRHQRQEAGAAGTQDARLRPGRGRSADAALQRFDVRAGIGARAPRCDEVRLGRRARGTGHGTAQRQRIGEEPGRRGGPHRCPAGRGAGHLPGARG